MARFFSRIFNVSSTKTTRSRDSEFSWLFEKHAGVHNNPALPEEIARQFSLAEIKAATNNFQEDLVIGQGSFGHVYKGFFHDGNLVVAVKRLSPDSRQGFLEFQTELMLLCQLRHQNLVSLIGFCNDKEEMILVYEYMRNGSLRDHLYGSGYDPLPWKQRLEICIGAARGLHYLHTGAKQAIIHRDIKSSNILLDDNWVCKLCDFGLSKLRPRSKSKSLEKINTAVKGSWGYLDPEYARGNELSEKSDVYSFGVVLFEVLCARKAIDKKLPDIEVNLAFWAGRCIGEGTIYKVIDPYLMGRIAPECFKIFVDIAYSCTSQEGNRRPEMGEVEVMLERALELQEKADSDTVHLAPNGEYMYEEASFGAFDQEDDSTATVDSCSVEDDAEITYSAPDLSSFTEYMWTNDSE
ncbi:hypothetical protein PTKIN_Ptkin12aG0024400 [Pterospermum kingtungense]